MSTIPVDTYQQGQPFTWSRSMVMTSPGPMVQAGDYLRLSAYTSDATGVLQLNGRLMDTNGVMRPMNLSLTFSGTGVQTAVTIPLMDGWVMGFNVFVLSGTITDGEVQASVDVVQGSGTGATPVMCLASGEVTNVRRLGLNAYPALFTQSNTGNLIGIQTFTATGAGVYTPTAGTHSVIIQMVGGGGGGAGIAVPSLNQVTLGGGGGGGAFLQKRLTASFSGAAYVVGAKGTGGAAGNNNGNAGADTTFTDTSGAPVTYTAGGGGGGLNRTTAAPPNVAIGGDNNGVPNGAGGTATNGDLNVPGGGSVTSFSASTAISWSGAGGNSMWGRGAYAVYAASGATTAGANASGKGAGGSGAMGSSTGGANKAGGDGTDGQIVVYEYA